MCNTKCVICFFVLTIGEETKKTGSRGNPDQRDCSIHAIKKVKEGNKNQKPFEAMMIMEYDLSFIGKVKMTVGIRRRTKEKVQYCITAISSE